MTKPGRRGVTKEEVYQACERLMARDVSITNKTVRAELGDTGSYGTIGVHVSTWKAERNQKRVKELEMTNFSPKLLAALADETNRRIVEVREEFRRRDEELEASLDEALGHIEESEAAVIAAEQKIEEQRQNYEKQLRTIETGRIQLASSLEEVRKQKSELTAETIELRQVIETQRTENAKHLMVAERNEKLEVDLKESTSRLVAVDQEAGILRVERDTAQKQLESTTKESASIYEELKRSWKSDQENENLRIAAETSNHGAQEIIAVKNEQIETLRDEKGRNLEENVRNREKIESLREKIEEYQQKTAGNGQNNEKIESVRTKIKELLKPATVPPVEDVIDLVEIEEGEDQAETNDDEITDLVEIEESEELTYAYPVAQWALLLVEGYKMYQFRGKQIWEMTSPGVLEIYEEFPSKNKLNKAKTKILADGKIIEIVQDFKANELSLNYSGAQKKSLYADGYAIYRFSAGEKRIKMDANGGWKTYQKFNSASDMVRAGEELLKNPKNLEG